MIEATFYIDGEWKRGSETFRAVNPASGEQYAAICHGNQEDVDAAVAAARRAFASWRERPSTERAELVGQVAAGLLDRYGSAGQSTDLKDLITLEVGKRLPEADIEVIESSDMLSYFVAEAPKLLASRMPTLNSELWPTKRSIVTLEPVGVVGIIKPWNYPLELPIWAIGPALIAGNTVVFKPSEHSSLVALEIGRLCEEAGIPAGVLNIVTGDATTGSALVEHSGVDMISFTGSVRVGREIAVECARRGIKCSAELGGNDAAVVDADADLELTANGLVWGAFCNGGQVCVGIKRAFVHDEIVGELTELVVAKTKALRFGIEIGPLISEGQIASVERFLVDAEKKGARVLVGGRRSTLTKGFFFEPTVLANVIPSMDLMQHECFGPVLPIIPVSSAEEGLRLANDSCYGLGASVWTSDITHGEMIAREFKTGMVWVNDVNVAFPQTPWGGIRQSGPGVALSDWGLYEFVQPKHISLETSKEVRRSWWYPY